MLLIEPCIFIFNILCQKCPRLVTQPSHSTDGGIKNMNFVQKKEFETLACLFIMEKKVGIWTGDTDASQTDRQQNIELLSLSTV